MLHVSLYLINDINAMRLSPRQQGFNFPLLNKHGRLAKDKPREVI
jgi:hypothetical protein